ncbi:DUF1796 family putative cysteine peptidase [Paenibacillus lentus]|uniref:Peptidase n=1 Tax=Paenibacillus lentus TaxID=1338368 RepID=A0A3Q8SCR9_9BACL|nr:DUF1796 family putative cysteine peptidase [Paenibacillus lentus]AZK47580.1 hypothetical protein EIM92_16670 [Paenibacillus lentus]
MRRSEMQRPYDFVMSLGYNCMVAYQLKRLSLRTFSAPIDWVIIHEVKDVIRLLDQRFHGYMEERNLEILGKHNGFFSVKDTVYNAHSFHDFPCSGDNQMITNYNDFKAKLDRRISRFISLASQSDSALFVRERCSYEEAIRLRDSLASLVKGKVTLLIINYTKEARLVEHDWLDDGICGVDVNLEIDDEAWRDSYWNDAFRGVSVK